MAATGLSQDNTVARRRGYYDYPAIWRFDYIQSIESEFSEGDAYARRRNELKDEVKMMLNEITDPLDQLENIDILQRLGVYYHFEDEIESILKRMHSTNDFGSDTWKENLYATALKFRILRQHLYSVPQDVFDVFKDGSGKFKECVRNDVKGLLSLYEASFLLTHGETSLEEARDFTSRHLQEFVNQNEEDTYLAILVRHALKVPLHWRPARLEVRWFIDLYRRSHEILNPAFLELSILDYNLLQPIYQQELRELSRWWRHVGLAEKMNFFRDRLVENYLLTVEMTFQPQHAYCREMVTKYFTLVTLVDDTYDMYGTLEELELLTTAFESWDMNPIDPLPDYLKLTFLAVFNFTNELAFHILKEKGIHVIKYLKKAWADLSRTYIQEAKWYYTGTKPATFKEYIENAWVSIAIPVALVIAYFSVENPIKEDVLELLESGYPSIIHQSSLIIRLLNDLFTISFEKKMGDVPKSVECYMYETSVSEDEARQHIFSLVNEAWKQVNEDRATNTVISPTFIEAAIGLAKMTAWYYDGRDGFGTQNQCRTKDCATSVLVKPISFAHGEQLIWY